MTEPPIPKTAGKLLENFTANWPRDSIFEMLTRSLITGRVTSIKIPVREIRRQGGEAALRKYRIRTAWTEAIELGIMATSI